MSCVFLQDHLIRRWPIAPHPVLIHAVRVSDRGRTHWWFRKVPCDQLQVPVYHHRLDVLSSGRWRRQQERTHLVRTTGSIQLKEIETLVHRSETENTEKYKVHANVNLASDKELIPHFVCFSIFSDCNIVIIST